MKAEINQENKTKFFALYWEQDIVHHSIESPFLGYFNSLDEEHMYNHGVDYYSLGLKPLSQISDKDAINVGLIHVDGMHPMKPEWVKELILYFEVKNDIRFEIVDYLRSKGYALPWMGLSVNEMIEAGWIKLTEQ